jgi:hypothetical protein
MADRVQILKDWIAQEGRKQNWVARQVGCSPQWLNYVLQGKKPLSDKLADALQTKLGIPLIHSNGVAGYKTKQQAGSKTQKKVKVRTNRSRLSNRNAQNMTSVKRDAEDHARQK